MTVLIDDDDDDDPEVDDDEELAPPETKERMGVAGGTSPMSSPVSLRDNPSHI